METINLKIPAMKSSHCQITVTQAVKNAGAAIASIAPTAAAIELMNGVTKEAVIKAIQNAGYKVND
jgi:copper chaperone CopZ